jgi:hypothetical protein
VRAKRVKRMSAAPRKAARTQAKKTRRRLPPWVAGPGPILFGVACVACFVGAVALNLTGESPRRPDVTIAAAAPDAKAPVPQKPRAKAERQQAAAVPSIDTKKSVAPEETQPEATPAPAFNAPVQKMASVTITGCLEHDDESFWLSDASGADAPTARTWKSGFLKKRPSRIELIDAQHALPLTSYVGRRVSATGTIVNREMQTRSLHPLSATCS